MRNLIKKKDAIKNKLVDLPVRVTSENLEYLTLDIIHSSIRTQFTSPSMVFGYVLFSDANFSRLGPKMSFTKVEIYK